MLSAEKARFVRSLGDGGYIEPAAVVEAARDPKCILHDEFEWDIRAAAEAHWLDTARSLIRFVRLETTTEPSKTMAPFYVIDPARPPRSNRYVELNRAARDREVAERVLADEVDRIVQAIRRAQSVAGVLGLGDKLADLLDNVNLLRSQAEQAAADRAKRDKPRARRRSSRPEARA
jgi:hypothetical protein